MTPQPADLRGTTLSPALPSSASATSAPTAIAQIPPSNLLQKIGYWFLVAYLFIALSRILDVTFHNLRVPAFLYVCLGVMAILSGGLLNILRTSTGRAMLFLFGWCLLSVPFSTWQGGSAAQFQEVAKAFFLGAAIIAIPRTTQDTIRLTYVVAAALLGASILVWFYGRLDLGRLVMNAGTYSDPNQFAMTLLMALPFLVGWAARTKSWVWRVIAGAATIPILVAFLRTGSRGALFGFGIMLVFAFFWMRMKSRVILVASMVALFVVSLLVLPNYILARYLTFFSERQNFAITAEEERQFTADIGSSMARWNLLIDSVVMTVEHPIFGVGIGQFPQQNWERKKLAGKPNAGYAALVTHNIYTQFSSEAGLPALILYIALLVQCFRSLSKILKRAPNLAPAVQGLRLSLIVLTCCGFFLAVAYTQVFYILAGITARLYMTAFAEYPARQFQPVSRPISMAQQKPANSSPVMQPDAKGLPPRNKLSPWRTNTGSNYVRNSGIS